ncbi:tetratricopeptide repeat protein [Rhodocaloribacter sp.]
MRLFRPPQLLGIFPAPASYLLLPAVDGAPSLDAARTAGRWPEDVPEAWRFFSLALAGDAEAAHAAVTGEDAVARYNRFVLAPDAAAYERLKAEAEAEDALLMRAVGYLYRLEAEPPEPPDDAPDVLAAFLWATRAGRHLEAGDADAALAHLARAVEAARTVSPALAARLLATTARARRHVEGPSPALVPVYRAAVDALGDTAFERLLGETWLDLGSLYHEISGGRRGALLEAAKCYQSAAQCCPKEAFPELFALAQNNLALAYLAIPLTQAGDRLRMAVAIGALREALTVYTREAHPEAWASATLNLANALQYAPTGTPEEHLWQAVDLYEQVLEVRAPEADPLAYARVLANQANALAHLGAFSRAVPRLEEAARLFRAHDEPDAAASVEAILHDIETRRANHGVARKTTV